MAEDLTITINTESSLDVVNKQNLLIQEALGADGVYIRMKNHLIDLLDDGAIPATEKAKIVTSTLSSMAQSITNNAMSVGLQWAKAEKELSLEREKLSYTLAIEKEKIAMAVAQAETAEEETRLKQAQLIRDYGTVTKDVDGNVTELGNDGRLYAQELDALKSVAVKGKQVELLSSQKDESVSNRQLRQAQLIRTYGSPTKDGNEDVVALSNTGKDYVEELSIKQEIENKKAQESGLKQEVINTQFKGLGILEENRKKKYQADIDGASVDAKVRAAEAQADGAENTASYTKIKEEQLVKSVVYNNKIKAIESIGSTYGTLGAGQVLVDESMWTVYFNLAADLSNELVDYIGAWDATGAFPGSADATMGDFYNVTTEGTTSVDGGLGSGYIAEGDTEKTLGWAVGDLIVYDGNRWKLSHVVLPGTIATTKA